MVFQNYYFEICAMIIHVLVIFAVIYRKTYRGKANAIFLGLNVLAFAVALLDVINGMIKTPLPTSELAVGFSLFFSSFYYVARNAIAAIYVIFLIRYFRLSRLLRNIPFLILLALPFLSAVGIVIANPFTGIGFTVDLENGYQRGSLVILFYAFAFVHLVTGIVLLLFVRKTISIDKWLSLIGLYALTIVAIILQAIWSDLMVELLTNAISFLIITFTVLRPEELTDPSTGLPSYRAFQFELTKALSSKEEDRIVFLRIVNANSLRAYLGLKDYLHALTSIALRTLKHSSGKGISVDVFLKGSDTLIFLGNGKNLDPKGIFDFLIASEKDYFPEAKASMQAMDVRGVALEIPSDSHDEAKIIRLGDSFIYFMDPKDSFAEGKSILEDESFMIQTDLGMIFRRALDSHTLSVSYQPIYDLSAKRFRSAEALARLDDEVYGPIPPSLFIPAAERQNLLRPVSDLLLDEAYRFIGSQKFEETGLDYIEVNLSVLQCLDPGLLVQVKQLQEKYKVDPRHINFEITESMYARDSSLFEKNIAALVAEGYAISLDDYGTGYSNINRLLSLPLSIIKIDKTMVDAAKTEEGANVLIHSIKMMKGLEKKVVVEGVETEEQLSIASAGGADFIQGFLFAKALSEEELLSFLQSKMEK